MDVTFNENALNLLLAKEHNINCIFIDNEYNL